jgi:hypothetical protein
MDVTPKEATSESSCQNIALSRTIRCQSRRPDSNRGPLHYEAWAGAGRGGSDAGICRRDGRSRVVDVAVEEPVWRGEASIRLPRRVLALNSSVGSCPSPTCCWSWSSSTLRSQAVTIAGAIGAPPPKRGVFDRVIPPRPGDHRLPIWRRPGWASSSRGHPRRRRRWKHRGSPRATAAAASLLAG